MESDFTDLKNAIENLESVISNMKLDDIFKEFTLSRFKEIICYIEKIQTAPATMETVLNYLGKVAAHLADPDSAPSMESREPAPELLESVKTAMVMLNDLANIPKAIELLQNTAAKLEAAGKKHSTLWTDEAVFRLKKLENREPKS